MKQLTLIQFILLFISTGALAAPISVGNIDDIYVANEVLGYSNSAACESSQTKDNCYFLTPNPTTYLNKAGLSAAVTSDAANYVLNPYHASGYIDLGFNGYDIYNGDGNDLVVFIVGNSTTFGLDIYDINGAAVSEGAVYDVPANGSSTVFDTDGKWLCVSGLDGSCTNGAALSAIFIDLEDSIAGDVALGSIRIWLGEDYNGTDDLKTRPRFSLAGGFHTEPTVVPLPLPVVLFSSGLALLGWIGRRKTL
jgi:hypothetical protein